MAEALHEAAIALGGLTGAYVLLLALIWVPVRLAQDMRRRGRTGWLYAVAYLGLPPVGVLAWLVDRRRFPLVVDAH